MPPQIPSPIVAGGGGRRPDPLQQILLGLVSQAPNLIFNILEQRRAGQEQQQAGDASKAILASMQQQGIGGDQLIAALEAAGAAPVAGTALPGGSAPATPATGPINVPARPADLDLSAIPPTTAQELLEQFRISQESQASIGQSRAATAESQARTGLAEAQTQGALTNNRLGEIELRMKRIMEPLEIRRAELGNQLAQAQIANNASEMEARQRDLDRLEQQAERQAVAAAEDLTNSQMEQLLRWTQVFAAIPATTPEQARTLAVRATFGQNTIPTRTELRERNREILAGGSPGLTDEQRRTQIAGQIGLPAELQSAIDQGVAQFETIPEAWEAFRERIEQSSTLSDEQKAERVLLGGLYLEAVSGESLDLQKVVKKKAPIYETLLRAFNDSLDRALMGLTPASGAPGSPPATAAGDELLREF